MSWQVWALVTAIAFCLLLLLALYVGTYEAYIFAAWEHERRESRCEGFWGDITDHYWIDLTRSKDDGERPANRATMAEKGDAE